MRSPLDLIWLSERFGDGGTAALGGLLVGLIFGACAQRSQFCLRAATVEFWRGSLGPKVAIWLIVFGAALFGTQTLIGQEALDTETVRQLTQVGSLSGAIIGGLLFGAGMVLARGCASRLLVLSATGNLRALVAGLILTVVAQASLRGVLSPARLELGSWWIVDADTRNLMNVLPEYTGVVAGFLILSLGLGLAVLRNVSWLHVAAAVGVASSVVLGWAYTSALAAQAFDVIPVGSVTFTGPSADTLMAFINQPDIAWSFGLGLVPGVFVGSGLAALISGDFRIVGFDETTPLPRYIVGACLMGFGSMLAGGCAVGAGVTGGSVLALTAWVALAAMWAGAGLADAIFNRSLLFMSPAAVPGTRGA